MADLLFVGQFIASKAGKTGLTVTVDVDRYTLADGSRTALITAGAATEGRRGLYHYRLVEADLATYQYVATFVTTDTSVDQQEIAALGLVVPDALVSSRLAPTTAGRTLDIAATGEASANVTMQAGVLIPGPLALEATAQAVLEDTSTTLPALIAGIEGGGSYAGDGTGYYSDTIDDGTNPLDGVRVQLYTAPNRVGPAYEAYTNALGVFVMHPDPGTYYRWLDLAGFSFTQDVAVVVTE